MSELEIETSFRENLCQKFSRMNLSISEPDTHCSPPVIEFKNSVAFFDFNEHQVTINEPHMCGDARRPPLRFCNLPASKSPQELLQSIHEKLQKSAQRREQFIQNIVLKSRRFVENVQKVRERLSKKELESSQHTQNLLREKRQAADKIRQRAVQVKLDRIRNRLEHAEVVKNRKFTNSSPDQSPEKSKSEDTPTPQSNQIKSTNV